MKRILILLLFSCFAFASQTLQPSYTIKADGLVSDLLYEQDKLYVATASGVLHLFDLQTKQEIMKITLPKIESFDFSLVGAKIYSIDKIGEKLLITSQGKGSYRNTWVYEAGNLEKIISTNEGFMTVKSRFIDEDTIFFATLSNQVFLYDLRSKTQIYENQLSYSSFSDFELSSDKKTAAATDESGEVHLVNTADGSIIKEFKGQNVDRIYDIDFKNGVILGAGQDRRLSVYKKFSAFYLSFDFLLYACALSPDSSLAAVAYNTANDVAVYDLSTKTKLYDLIDNKAVVTKILFIGNDAVFISSDSEIVNFYKF